jgi:transposase
MAKRDPRAIEARRIEGTRLLKRRVAHCAVARRLKVSRQAVSVWARQLEAVNGAVGKLKAKPLGRPRRLDDSQCGVSRQLLLKGALAAGFPTELCTIKRVRVLIKREFGLSFSHTGCWQLLRAMGITPQKPERRALQPNEQAVVQWKQRTWPAPSKAPAQRGRTIVFMDEPGLSEKCPRTRTWALKGHTPVTLSSSRASPGSRCRRSPG